MLKLRGELYAVGILSVGGTKAQSPCWDDLERTEVENNHQTIVRRLREKNYNLNVVQKEQAALALARTDDMG